MNTATGTYRHGQVQLDTPVDWREGMRVRIVPEEEPLGIPEDNWPTTPEAIAGWLARVNAIEPLELTPEEKAEIAAARAAFREADLQAVRKEMGL